MGFHPLAEVCLYLDDSRDKKRQSSQASNFDGQMDTFVRMDSPQEDQILAARFLERVQTEVDSVIYRREIIQPRCAISIADRNEISVAILFVHRHNSGRRKSVDG